MIRPFISIISCKRDQENGFNQAVRETWLKSWGNLIDYRFFLGSGAVQKFDDEVILDVDDRYLWLVEKVYFANKWALKNNFNFVFKCDTDTYVHIPRLLKSGFEQYEYVGNKNSKGCMSGGPGYWLGPQALKLSTDSLTVYHRAEDLNMGQIMRSSNVPLTHDSRYTLWIDQQWNKGKYCTSGNDVISIHLTYEWNPGGYKTEYMYVAHEQGIKI